MPVRTNPSNPALRAACAAVSFVLLALASACAMRSHDPLPPPDVNLSGYPLAFRQGYADGCDSARRGTEQRDAERFGRDAQYQRGWQDGFSVCGRRGK